MGKIKVLKPSYYDEFQCIGEACENTCCAGWNIYIDKTTYKKYMNVKNNFRKELKNNIKQVKESKNTEAYAVINLNKGICPFLNERKLCNIYSNLGADYLSNTCKKYPRSIYKVNDIYEKNLNLSCPEVARIFIANKDLFSFNIEDEEFKNEEKKLCSNISQNQLLNENINKYRNIAIQIAQFQGIELWKRLNFIIRLSGKIRNIIKNKEFIRLDDELYEFINIVTDKSVIESLDSIEKINHTKVEFIGTILKRKINSGGNKKLIEMFNTVDIEKEVEFEKYFKKYEYVLENYIVYSLFSSFSTSVIEKDIAKENLFVMVNYSIVKMLLLSRWQSNDEELTEKDIVEIISLYCREFEHDRMFNNELYNNLMEKGYDSEAYLTILIR